MDVAKGVRRAAEKIGKGLLVSVPAAAASAQPKGNAAPAISVIQICGLRFLDDLQADLVACQIAVNRIAKSACNVEIAWPQATLDYASQLKNLMAEAADYHKPNSIFHGQVPKEVADFTSSARWTLEASDKIRANVGERTKKLVNGMLPYWTEALDNIIAGALTNFLTLCNYEMIYRTISLFRHRAIYNRYFPMQYEPWFGPGLSIENYRLLFWHSGGDLLRQSVRDLVQEGLCKAPTSGGR